MAPSLLGVCRQSLSLELSSVPFASAKLDTFSDSTKFFVIFFISFLAFFSIMLTNQLFIKLFLPSFGITSKLIKKNVYRIYTLSIPSYNVINEYMTNILKVWYTIIACRDQINMSKLN